MNPPLLLPLPVPNRAWEVTVPDISTCITRGRLYVGERVRMRTYYSPEKWDGGGTSDLEATFVGIDLLNLRPYVNFVDVVGTDRRGRPKTLTFIGIPFDHFVAVP